MTCEAKDYSPLTGIEGFSETLLENHFTPYSGNVTSTDKLAESLAAMLREGKVATPEYSQPKRRMGSEFNGMRVTGLGLQ